MPTCPRLTYSKLLHSGMSSRLSLLTLIFALFAPANAQFQFFNGMFGNQHQHQQQSGGQQWAMHAESRTYHPQLHYAKKLNHFKSLLLGLSLRRYSRLRKAAHRMPVPSCARCQVYRARHARNWERHATLHSWSDQLCTDRKVGE